MDAAPEKRAYPLALYGYLEAIDPTQVDREFDMYLDLDEPRVAATSLVGAVGHKNVDRGVELGRRLLERFPDSDRLHGSRMRSASSRSMDHIC